MNLFKVARNAVSKDKFRFQDGWFDLDLTYITSRIIAMGIPGQKMDKIWRNDGDDVATFLWFYHAKHFMVFNLSGEEYDYAKFDNRVLDFGFPDHSACPLALLFQIVEAMKKWLSEDEENVAVVHCLAGRGRTGMVISTYLLREGFFRDAKAALKFFAEARSATAAGVLTPSQIRYAHYANEIYRGRIDPPFGKERPLVLRKIVVSPFPVIPDADDVQRMGGWEPVIKVLTLQGHHKEKNNERLLYSSDYHPTKLYYSKPGNIRVVREVDNGTVNQEKERIRSKLKQREKIVVDITKGCFVRGDIQLKFFHQASSRISFARILKSGYLKPVEVLSTALSKKYPYICLFRLSFHTSFVGRQLNEIIAKQQRESGGAVTTESMGESYDGGNGTVSWTLRKEELDAMFSGPAHTKMLPDDFAIKLVFGYPDASDDTPEPRSSSSSPSPSMRGSGGSRSTPNLPPLPPLPSVDGTTSAVASLALSPRGPEQREKLAQRRTGDGRPNARATVNFSGGKYKEAEHQPSPSRGQRGTISYSSIKRHATGPLQNERKAQERSIDFEDIFLKTPATASSRDRSEQRISESTEPTFPPASAMRRRSSLPPSSAQHAADAAAATAAVHKKSVTPSPPRPNPSTRPDVAPTQTRGASQPPAERDVSPTHRADIMTSTPAVTSSLHSPLRPAPPSSSSSFPSLPHFSTTSPPASMTPPGSGGSLSSNGQATPYAYPPSTIAAAAASHNRQSLLQSYPPTHPVLTPTAAGLVAPVSAPVPSPAHTAVLTPTPSHPAMSGGGAGQGLPTHPHSAPAQFVAGAGDGSALHTPLTPVSVRPGSSNPPQPQPQPLNASSGVSPARASTAMGQGHAPLQPTPATLSNGSGNSHGNSNGNVGQLPSYVYAHQPQQPQPQHQQHFFALHPPLQPVPVLHQDFSSRLPPVRFPPPASSAQAIDEAQRERIRQQIIAERQRALYPQQPQTQPSQVTQSQPQYHHQPQQPERARDQSNTNMERRRQLEDERTRRDSWERERAAAADRGRGRGRGGSGDDGGDDRDDRRDRGGGRGGGGGGGDGRPRGRARGGGSGNGGRGGPPATSPRRTYHISEML